MTSEQSLEWLREAAAGFEELHVEDGFRGIARLLEVRDICRLAQKGSAGYGDRSGALFDALRTEERRRQLYAEMVPAVADVLTAAIAAERAADSTAANLYNEGAVLRAVQRSCLMFLGNVGPTAVFDGLGTERFSELVSSIAELFEPAGDRRTAAQGLYVLARLSLQFPDAVFEEVRAERAVSFIRDVVRDAANLDMRARFGDAEWNFVESSLFMLVAVRAVSEESVPDVETLFSAVEDGERQVALLSAVLSADWTEREQPSDVIDGIAGRLDDGDPGSVATVAYQALVSQQAKPDYARYLLHETLAHHETGARELFRAVEWLVVEGSLDNHDELVSLAIDGLRERVSTGQTGEIPSYYWRLIFVCLFEGAVSRSTMGELQRLLSERTTTVYYDPSTARTGTAASPHDVGPVDLLALLDSTNDVDRDAIRATVDTLTLDLLSDPNGKHAVLTRLLQYQQNGLLSEPAARRVSNAVLAEFYQLSAADGVGLARAVGYRVLVSSFLLPMPERYKVALFDRVNEMVVSDVRESLIEGPGAVGQCEGSDIEVVAGLLDDAAEFGLLSRRQASTAIQLCTAVLAEYPGAIQQLHEPLQSIFETYSIGRTVSTETFARIARLENGLPSHTRLLLYAISADGRVARETFLEVYRQLLRVDAFDPMLLDRAVSEYDLTRRELDRGVRSVLGAIGPTTPSHELLTASVFLSKTEAAHAGLVSERSVELRELSLNLAHTRDVKALTHLAAAGLASRSEIIAEVVRTITDGSWTTSSAADVDGNYERLTEAIEGSANGGPHRDSDIVDIRRLVASKSLPPKLRLLFLDELIEQERFAHSASDFGAT